VAWFSGGHHGTVSGVGACRRGEKEGGKGFRFAPSTGGSEPKRAEEASRSDEPRR
jgi:hypothetical protein